jgi:hypothetical protein
VKKLIMIAALVSAVVAPPVYAKGPKPAPPTPPAPKNCQVHSVSYEVSGTLVSGSLTLNADGTYSGTITVHVTKANNHAKDDKGTDKSYTLTSSKANLHGANPASLAVGSHVKLEGSVTTLAKKCNQSGFTATVTIAHADLKAPNHH